jgi:hypothetical protein
MGERMLAGFALYKEPEPVMGGDHDTIHTPLGTRLMRMIRLYHGWRLWVATKDFRYGTYYELFNDGRILHCTTRVDEGDDYYWSRPDDETINKQRNQHA